MISFPAKVNSDINFIDKKIEAARALEPATDAEALSMACEFLCVAIVGRIEQGIKEICKEHIQKRAGSKFDMVVERFCSQFQNPKPDKILELLGLFDKECKRRLEKIWEEDEEMARDQIKGMVSKRINIAHQKVKSANITIAQIDGYFHEYKKLMTNFYKCLNI